MDDKGVIVMAGEKASDRAGMIREAQQKPQAVFFDQSSELYLTKYFGQDWLVNDLDEKEAAAAGLTPDEHRRYSEENIKIMAKRKEQARRAGPARAATLDSIETERAKEDEIEASDIHLNSDLVLQYEAEFTNRRTGEKTTRKWLGVNAWKLGLIEGYIKAGFSCGIGYNTEGDVVKCTVKLKKGDQEVSSEGVYTKTRLRSFLSSSKEEAFETFAFRNAIKKIVSLKDVVTAVKAMKAEIEAMGALPTKQVKEIGE